MCGTSILNALSKGLSIFDRLSDEAVRAREEEEGRLKAELEALREQERRRAKAHEIDATPRPDDLDDLLDGMRPDRR